MTLDAGKDDRRFAGWAAGYERDGLAAQLASLCRECLVRLALRHEDRFLDVGCATGAAVRAASETTHLAMGVDRSLAMIAQARSLAGTVGRFRFLRADAAALPFATASVTAILCASTLRHLNDPRCAVREFARVLGPGGRLVVGDFLMDSRAIRDPARAEPFAALDARGLSIRSMEVALTPFGHYVITVIRRDSCIVQE